jgi:hypothetical protein
MATASSWIRSSQYNYSNPTVVAFNVTYNNGGGGVHVFNSQYVTVANNSCCNYIDPADKATWRGCIDSADSFGGTYINNIAVAIPATVSNCQVGVAHYAMWNSVVLASPAQTPYKHLMQCGALQYLPHRRKHLTTHGTTTSPKLSVHVESQQVVLG